MGCPAEVEIGDNLVFSVCTHDPDTGVLTDADAVPAYRVYEDETDPPILTGNMAKLDDDDTTGFYTESIACTSGNGFENGKSYTVYIVATVDGDQGGICYSFKAYDQRKANVIQWLSQACAAVTVNGVPEVDLTHVMGTILTEGGAGRLAAAFIKLFDVVTPVLLASDVMRGTDGANTTVPDAAGVAPTVAEIVDEWDRVYYWDSYHDYNIWEGTIEFWFKLSPVWPIEEYVTLFRHSERGFNWAEEGIWAYNYSNGTGLICFDILDDRDPDFNINLHRIYIQADHLFTENPRQWHHLAATWHASEINGESSMDVFLDGTNKLVMIRRYDNTEMPMQPTVTKPLNLGNNFALSQGAYCYFDEFRISNVRRIEYLRQ